MALHYSTSVQVSDVGTNWQPIPHHFEVIADQRSKIGQQSLCVFEPLFGSLGATYAVHFRLIQKLIVDFLLVLISLRVTAEALWVNTEYWFKSDVFKKGGSVSAKFSFSCRRSRPPPNIFAPIDRPLNALQLCHWQYSHKKNCVAYSLREMQF